MEKEIKKVRDEINGSFEELGAKWEEIINNLIESIELEGREAYRKINEALAEMEDKYGNKEKE